LGLASIIFDLIGETPFALALCAPAAFVLFRLISPRGLVHRARGAVAAAARASNRSGELNYAPKSIS